MTLDVSGPSKKEELLVARCRAGDDEAWAALYQAHAPRVARFLRRVNGAHCDVEDLVQQVFVELFTTLDRLRDGTPVVAWLYGIAANVARKSRRTTFRRLRRTAALGEERASVSQAAPSPEARVGAREVFAVVEQALAKLKPEQREAWVLVELEGLTGQDAALALGVPSSTLRTRLQVARQHVARAVARHARTAEPDPFAGRRGEEAVLS